MSEDDPIEKAIGRFGRYQAWTVTLIFLGRIHSEIQLLNVVFLLPSVSYVCLDEGGSNGTDQCPCLNPRYDTSTIVSSVTSEFNLICDRTYLASLSQSVMAFGILVGSLVFGNISDKHGRKTAVVSSLFLEAMFVLMSGVVPDLWMLMACRFLIGTTIGGAMLCCYVLLIEISGKSARALFTGLVEIPYLTAYALAPGIAYFFREWRTFQLVTSIPWLTVIIYHWLLPESPRWLITMGRREEAIDLLSYIAQKNRRSTDNIKEYVMEIERQTSAEKAEPRGSYLDLFRTPKIRKYTIIVAFIWMFCAHTYSGINQYIGRLAGNLYLNVLYTALSLIPALLLVVLCLTYFRRKVTLILTFSYTAVVLLVFIFLPTDASWTNTFAILGVTGIYMSFMQLYLLTTELFPTVIRNSAMGFSSMFARFGSFLAPFVVNIGMEWISILIFSAVAAIAGVLCCLIPETKDIVLLNTIQQTEEPQNKTTAVTAEEINIHNINRNIHNYSISNGSY